MKIDLVKHATTGKVIGYNIIPETQEEKETLGNVRDLIFFGFNETAMRYNGIELGGDGSKCSENLEKLKFIQKQFLNT